MQEVYQKYMQRCIDLAYMGLGNTYSNPMVGAVVVYDNKIIGEGYHTQAGKPHAEVNAINMVKDKNLLKHSTIYVSLEPCAHFGKTPPCANLIVEHKIPNVIIGTIDPFAKVAGRGIEILKNAGCKVELGILEKECLELNKRFFTYHQKKRPFVVLKWAQTLDGFIDINRNLESPIQTNWITNDVSKVLVHKWRSEEQAILIGTNTAQNDNPVLNVRDWSGKNPLRIIIDKNLRLNKNFNIFADNIQTIILYDKNIENSFEKENIEFLKIDFSENIIYQILNVLYEKQIQSLIVEGGTILINSFLELNLWDEARVFIGNKLFEQGVKAPIINKQAESVEQLNSTKLLMFNNYN